jgi:hypothetical protein
VEAAQQAEGGLDALAGQPVERPADQHVVSGKPGVGEGLGELLAVLALPCRRGVEDVLVDDLQAAAVCPLAQLGELIAGVLVIGADSRTDSALARNANKPRRCAAEPPVITRRSAGTTR